MCTAIGKWVLLFVVRGVVCFEFIAHGLYHDHSGRVNQLGAWSLAEGDAMMRQAANISVIDSSENEP